MDMVTLGAALKKSKEYTDSVALNGVPVRTPRIDPNNNHWLLFDPVLNDWVDSGVPADGGAADLSGIFIELAEIRSELTALQSTDENLLQLINDLQLLIDNFPNMDLSGILADIANLQSSIVVLGNDVDTAELDIADLQSKLEALTTLVGEGGGVDLSGILSDIQAIQVELQTLENGLSSEISNREQAIADKQQQLSEINSALVETNRVLSGKVTQRLTTMLLSDDFDSPYTAVPKSDLSATIPLIQGGSWVSDTEGTLGIYAGDYDDNTAAIRTVTTSSKVPPNIISRIESLETGKSDKGHGHGANEVTFEDGDTFQEKYDNGDLRGQTGFANLTPRGVWSATIADYTNGNTVLFDNGTSEDSYGVVLPVGEFVPVGESPTNTDYWQIVIHQGAPGKPGEQGEPGEQGNPGVDSNTGQFVGVIPASDPAKVEIVIPWATTTVTAAQITSNLNGLVIPKTGFYMPNIFTNTVGSIQLTLHRNGVAWYTCGGNNNQWEYTTQWLPATEGDIITVQLVSGTFWVANPGSIFAGNTQSGLLFYQPKGFLGISEFDNVAMRSDGQVLRLRIPNLTQAISSTPWAFLQGRTLESIVVPEQTNIDYSQWSLDPVTGALTFPNIDAYVKYDIDVRPTGTSTVSGNNSAAVICRMLRQVAQTVATSGRVTVTGALPTLNMESIFIPTFTMNAQDAYIQGGVVPQLLSGATGTISQLDIVIFKNRH